MNAFAHDRYELRRKFISFPHTNFFLHGPGGDVVLYGRKKGFKLKEDIRLFADAELQREVLSIQARSIIDFSPAYDVTDSSTRARIGVLRRKGLRSILRDEWEVLDLNEQPLAIVQEDSAGMAFLRRFLSNLIPQSFHIRNTAGAPLGEVHQNFNPFRLRLSIDFSPDARRQLDRRLGVAAVSLLGTIEGRQD